MYIVFKYTSGYFYQQIYKQQEVPLYYKKTPAEFAE